MEEKRIIENERLRATVSDAGAELVCIYDKQEEKEVTWRAYPIEQYGFARNMEFTYVTGSDTESVHLLTSNEETLKEYPFEFGLEVTHQVQGNQILVQWVVKNIGYQPMRCNIEVDSEYPLTFKLEQGCCRNHGYAVTLGEKPGMVEIEPWKTLEAHYTITIGE